MIGYHSVPVIADAYMKGIRGYDTEDALTRWWRAPTYGPYGGLGAYMKLGYVPMDHEGEAASKTVEYAFDDWTIAHMAREMGNARRSPADIRQARRQLAQHLRYRRSALSAPRKCRRASTERRSIPRAAGYGSDYTEGNAWQYSWYHAAGRARPDPLSGRRRRS